MYAVKFCEVTRWQRYGKCYLDRLDMQAETGEKTLVYGSRGSGVKQLFRIAAGYEKPDEGQVLVNGRFHVIPERFPYFEGMTVAEYLEFSLLLHGKDSRGARVEALEFLKTEDLWQKRSVQAVYLEPAERCRLMVLMALVKKPEIVIMGRCMAELDSGEISDLMAYVGQRLDKNAALLCFADKRDIPFQFDKKYELTDGRIKRVD